MKTRVLFVSLNNICNQIATAFLEQLNGKDFDISSAWILSDEFSPLVMEVMEEVGINVSQNAMKFSDLERSSCSFDYIIILCEGSNIDKYPVFNRAQKLIYWELESPLADSPEEKLQKVRRIRDKIKSRIEHWLKESGFKPF